MTDVRLFHTADDGEIEIVNGSVRMDRVALEAAAYLSLFGGNADDRGLTADNARQWWGNVGEPVAERRYRSETQATLAAAPLVPATLRRVESAALRDTAWMVPSVARDVRATASMPAKNTIRLVVEIDVDNETITLEHTETR